MEVGTLEQLLGMAALAVKRSTPRWLRDLRRRAQGRYCRLDGAIVEIEPVAVVEDSDRITIKELVGRAVWLNRDRETTAAIAEGEPELRDLLGQARA